MPYANPEVVRAGRHEPSLFCAAVQRHSCTTHCPLSIRQNKEAVRSFSPNAHAYRSYSYFNASTGFVRAVFMEWKATVRNPKTSARNPTRIKRK